MKAKVLEKPTRRVKHAYTEIILDHLVVSVGETEEKIRSNSILATCFQFCIDKVLN